VRGRGQSIAFVILVAVCAFMGAVATWLVLMIAPVPEGTGLEQKIFYFHVPSAISMYAAVAVCSLSSLLFLLRGSDGWDAAGRAGAEVAVLYCVIVLVTGPIWARVAWGAAWVWDPRLTGVAVLGLILGAYHLVRAVGEESPASRKLAAALGVLAAPNGYLIHMAVQMWGGQHPTVIYREGGLDDTISAVFHLCIFTALLFCALLVWWRLDLELLRRRARASHVIALLGADDA